MFHSGGKLMGYDFWSFVEKTSTCWLWRGGRDHDGYGIFHPSVSETVRAHRWALAQHLGRDITGFVLHSCDTPPCVNHAHLREGSPKDNMSDMQTRGRSNYQRGIATGKARLTEKDVLDIRELVRSGMSQVDVALAFGVDRATVGAIHRRTNWGWLN